MSREVLVIIGELNVGGAENHLLQILPKINTPETPVSLYTLSRKGKLAGELESLGVKVNTVPLSKILPRLGWIAKPILLLLTSAKLSFLMLVKRPAVVHFFLPQAYLCGGICAWLTHCPVMLMSRRSLNCYQDKHPLLTKIECVLHKKLTLALSNSKAVYQQLLDEKIPVEKTQLIYNGVDTDKFKPDPQKATKIRAALGISEKTLVLTIVANLYVYKGHLDLLEALGRTVNHMTDDWILLCVGRKTPLKSRLEKRSKQLAIDERIRWLGERNDIPDLLTLTDIGLLCSHEEGFSNSILECMACAIPMVVTSVGGNSEAMQDQTTGFVVPPKRPRQLANALVKLANDKALRDKLGKAARERVLSHFSLDMCVDNYQQLYLSFLDQRDGLPMHCEET